MSEVLEAKAKIAQEVQATRELLLESCQRLAKLPRSTVATRQLNLILTKLDQWLAEFGPKPSIDESEPSRDEIDAALRAYRSRGFAALSVREQFIVEWFDKTYRTSSFSRRQQSEHRAAA